MIRTLEGGPAAVELDGERHVYGLQPVLAALKAGKRIPRRLLVRVDLLESDGQVAHPRQRELFREVLQLARTLLPAGSGAGPAAEKNLEQTEEELVEREDEGDEVESSDEEESSDEDDSSESDEDNDNQSSSDEEEDDEGELSDEEQEVDDDERRDLEQEEDDDADIEDDEEVDQVPTSQPAPVVPHFAIKPRTKRQLNSLTRSKPHQGLVLECDPFPTLEEFPVPNADEPDCEAPILRILVDSITDPQNLGTVVRSSAFFGVESLLVRKEHTSPLNATVSKVSAGALEYSTVYAIGSTLKCIEAHVNAGWNVLAATPADKPTTYGEERTFDVSNLDSLPRKHTLLLLGSEGFGLRDHLQEAANGAISIRGATDLALSAPSLDSLNVSVATGILLQGLTNRLVDSE